MLLTDQEARAYLRVSRTTLWRLRRSGALSFTRVGGTLRYRLADLETWLSRQTPKPQGALNLDGPSSGEQRAWREAWEATDWAFHDEATDYLTHSLHPYPAKFPPGLPARLIGILARSGDVVFDPFCGCGTTLVEARRLGFKSVGSDINPVAVLVSKAKTLTLAAREMDLLAELVRETSRLAAARAGDAPLFRLDLERMMATKANGAPPIPNLEKWFRPVVVAELTAIRSWLDGLTGGARLVAEACFSSIIVGVSNQDSETRYSSREKDISPGDTFRKYAARLGDALQMHRTWSSSAGAHQPQVHLADARSLGTDLIGRVDVVITSPPYANAFDYHLYHRHRLFWLGHDPAELRRSEIGSHLNHQRERSGVDSYQQDMKAAFLSIYSCLKPGGALALVVGDSVFQGATIDNAGLLSGIARKCGFGLLAVATRPIHPIKRSVMTGARRARREKIVLLVRKGREHA